MDRGAGGLQSMGSQRVRHNSLTNTAHLHFTGGLVAKTPPAMQVQSLVRELRSHMPQSKWAHVPQLESLCTAMNDPT